jgi:hypothetical protein
MKYIISEYIIFLFEIGIESFSLADKLLNDMLKATEAFNKLKKINDELKS